MSDTKTFPALPIDDATPHETNEGAVVLSPVAAWPIAGSGVWGVHGWSLDGWGAPMAFLVRRAEGLWFGTLPGAPGGDQQDAMHFQGETAGEALSRILAEIDV